MGSFGKDEECPFFDAWEASTSISESNFDSSIEKFDYNSSFNNWVEGSFMYDVWNRSPKSVHERRRKFLRWMGLDRRTRTRNRTPCNGDSLSVCSDGIDWGEEKVAEITGTFLETSDFEDVFFSGRSSISCWPSDEAEHSEMSSANNILYIDEINVDRLVMAERSGETSCSSPLLQIAAERPNNSLNTTQRVNKGWLGKLRSAACIFDRHGKSTMFVQGDDDSTAISKVRRVKVRHCKKQLKELSALYMGQDIQAHDGAILTMKFSLDGHFLATGGEDGIVKLWKVIEDERSNEVDVPEIDPSCIYFTVNHLSELKPLLVEKEKMANSTTLRKTSESACIIFPPKVFRIMEKPLHEFHGHSNEVLDLSWSKNSYLLSASVDKTVRLWRVGYEDCLKVFSHSNYVTCVHFNPVDENYFISGSIDGKIRIWGISSSQVVDWTDFREIVSAVCYQPDGQGGIVGSMNGTCRFYKVIGDNLEMDAEICLSSKKKSPSKKITGFQYSAEDSRRVMVSSADSRIRIIQGINVIRKYKGPCNTGNQISASFTSDGKHIISASGDSNVYLWNCNYKNEPVLSQVKKIRSYEYFSPNASIAVPWCGFKCINTDGERPSAGVHRNFFDSFPPPSPAFFSLSQELLESLPKGSATWPEEKLPTSSQLAKPSLMHKSRHKFLKSACQSTSSSHAWGLVIVTAGWDGRIRSFHNYGLPVHI